MEDLSHMEWNEFVAVIYKTVRRGQIAVSCNVCRSPMTASYCKHPLPPSCVFCDTCQKNVDADDILYLPVKSN